jgi:hypothetical protein
VIDLAEAERVLTEALAVVRELRAEREDVEAAERPIELSEAELAALFDVKKEALRSQRRANNANGLWRKAGTAILWSVPLAEQWVAQQRAAGRLLPSR